MAETANEQKLSFFTVSRVAVIQSTERLTLEMRTSSMLPGKEYWPPPPPNFNVAEPEKTDRPTFFVPVPLRTDSPSQYQAHVSSDMVRRKT